MIFELFVANGFDNTTIDDVAQHVGVSRSSFFRLFTSKEDAVLIALKNDGERLRDLLTDRPIVEPIWDALRNAFVAQIKSSTPDADRARRLLVMVLETPTLRARFREMQQNWVDLLAPEVARRYEASVAQHSDLAARAIVSAAISVEDAAIQAWCRSDSSASINSLVDLFEDAMNSVAIVVNIPS